MSTNPNFLWLGEKQKEALATLKYAIMENKGVLALTGDIGTGKTTLINALIKDLEEDKVAATIYDPDLEVLEFFNAVAAEFNMGRTFESKGEFILHFKQLLKKAFKRGQKVLLIIDEAQGADTELLEQIRLLSNLEEDNIRLINIFFVGQNEFIDIISDKQNRALRQRININYHLVPLKESEVKEYILHRLNVAGLKENIFSDNSISEIFYFSNGYPRLINIICDHALLTGCVKEVKTIDGEIIKECANGLFLTRGNNDYYKNDLKTTQEAIPAIEKEPTITPSEYTNRSNLPEERIDYLHDNPKTIERIIHEFVEELTLKSTGKKFGYLAGVMLLLIMLGFLYYPGNLGGHIDNIKNYFKPAPNVKEKIASVNIPQNTTLKQKINLAVQGSNKYDDTQFQSTDLSAESYHPPIVEKENVIGPQKIDGIKDLPPAEDFNQEKHPDKIYKSQEVPEHEFITTQKYIINFGYNSYDLSDKNLQTLERITKLLVQHPKADIIVKGHTDSYGNYKYNKKLSKLRANFVKSYFVDQGINSSGIKTFGMGQKNPIGSNKTLEGRRRNRRVEIELNINKT